MTKLFTFLVLSCLYMTASAQFFDRDRWDSHRHQVHFGLGASNFLGDLGGKDDVGTNDFQDLEINQTQFSLFVGHKYALYKKFYLRTDFTWGRVSGNDNTTQEVFRQNRNLSFKSNIFELAMMLEYEIPIKKRKGHIYDIKGAKGWKNGGSSCYLFGGFGAFYYNPKAEFQGEWIELRPLRTEGQGLPGGADEYGRFSWCIPVGASITKRISHNVSLGLQVSYRYTFTDYIDDVSTSYYNPYDIQLYVGGDQGELAAYLSNPSLGVAQEGLSARVTAPGQQRGDATDNDGYMFAWLTCHVQIRDKYRKGGSFKGKKRKYKPSGSSRSRKVIF